MRCCGVLISKVERYINITFGRVKYAPYLPIREYGVYTTVFLPYSWGPVAYQQ